MCIWLKKIKLFLSVENIYFKFKCLSVQYKDVLWENMHERLKEKTP